MFFLIFTQNDVTGLYSHLTGVPKALLPGIGGKKILDFWWETVNMYVQLVQTQLCGSFSIHTVDYLF